MGKWTVLQQPESQDQPAPRGGHASIEIGRRVICFGGTDRTPTPFSDIWVLHSGTDLNGAFGTGSHYEWTKVAPVSATGEKLLSRIGSTMQAIGDIIYIYGGQDPLTGQCFDDMIALDTNSWNWAQVEVPGVKPPSRHSHCAGVLNGRNLLVFGGAGSAGILGDLWVFDTLTRLWSHPKTSGSPATPREMHTGTMISETQMLVFGGRSALGQVLADAALFDAESMEWKSVEETPFPRCSHAAVAVPAWAAEIAESAVAESISQDAAGTSPSVANGNENGHQPSPSVVLVFGGYSGTAVEGNLLCIKPATMAATELDRRDAVQAEKELQQGILPQPRFAHTMAVITSNHTNTDVVVIAGVNSVKDLSQVAVWRPTRNQPLHLPLPSARGPL